jgi:(2Fe-2S) ferredoxin
MSRLPSDPPPHFRAHLFMCTNRRPPGHPMSSCADKGAQELAEAMRNIFKEMNLDDARANMAGCLGRCDKGPVLVIYPEGVWYSVKTPADIEEVLTKHLAKGERVERLIAPADPQPLA